jgi:hypothetical protein
MSMSRAIGQIRRLGTVTLAFLAIVAAACAPLGARARSADSPVAPTRFVPPDGTTYVGASTAGTGPAYDDFLQASGLSRLAIYNRWTTPNGSFDWILNEFARRPVAGMITWNLPGDGTQRSIASGAFDANIRARAAEAKAYGKPLFIRLNWEFNGSWYAWSARTAAGARRAGNSPADYIAAWRHVVQLFKQVPNVTFVWCPTLFKPSPSGGEQSDWAWWPGNEYVGWVGVDVYPGSASWEWMQNGTQGLNAFDRFARLHHKPLMVAEWALNSRTGDSPWWVDVFVDWMRAHPSVKAQIYFDYGEDGGAGKDDALARFPQAAERYRQLLSSDTGWLTSLTG